MVFTYLEPKEAAIFRWTGRVVAEIGLHYLTPKVCLRLREESYDRLLAIAQHPIASKCVVKLEYETEGLRFIDRKKFDQILTLKSMGSQRQDSSEQEASLNVPLPSKKWIVRKAKKLLNRVWSMYEDYQAGQQKVEQADFFCAKMVEAFERLPNLKTLSTPANSASERYIAEINELVPTYSFGDVETYKDPSCIGATRSVLLAAESAGLRLSNFHCHRFNWQTLKQESSKLPTPSTSISHLKVLNIAVGRYEVTDFIIVPCAKQRQVFFLITSAPKLERLGITFNTWPSHQYSPKVEEIIHDFHWPSLKAIHLDGLTSSKRDLVHFFERHKYTLREVSLRNMSMRPGLWEVTFHEMRRTFSFGQQLDVCTLGGTFNDRDSLYDMETTDKGYIDTTGKIISDYIRATDVGDITLGEFWDIEESEQLSRSFFNWLEGDPNRHLDSSSTNLIQRWYAHISASESENCPIDATRSQSSMP